MPLKTHLTLGRVSNLPTVWTNVLAAGLLAGATLPSNSGTLLLVAMSLFYIAGMYYNDACDADFDARHQPHRPIPSGLISRHQVEGFALVYAVVAIVLVYAASTSSPSTSGNASIGGLLGALCLIACIVTYNRHHKNNPFSPLLMAGCRVAVLVTSSYTLMAHFPPDVFLAVVAILAWLTGLTFLAKHEQTLNAPVSKLIDHWPLLVLCIPVLIGAVLSLSSPAIALPVLLIVVVIGIAKTRLHGGPAHLKGGAIALMIAGICLVDGIFLAWIWGLQGVVVSVAAFGMTLALQRWVAGT
ncbi:MAG: UbiA family prenyltransferase [Granulosicoccus sp.]